MSIVSKAAERSNKRKTEMLSLSRAEKISFTIRNKTYIYIWKSGMCQSVETDGKCVCVCVCVCVCARVRVRAFVYTESDKKDVK